MSFERIRKIGNHQYRFLERRYREDGKVKSKSKCLGRVDGGGRTKKWYHGRLGGNHEERTEMGEIAAQRHNEKMERRDEKKAEAVKAPAQEITPTVSETAPPSSAEVSSETSTPEPK